MSKLRALQVFAAIADTGSLTAAAKKLDSSLPTVVRQLASLEHSLGSRLFSRTTRSLSLTVDGARYLDRIRRVLADLEDADSELRSVRAVPAGLLVLTAPVLLGQMHLSPCLARFLGKHPQIRVRLLLEDRVLNLVEDGIDAAIRIGELPDSSLVAQSLGSTGFVVVASKSYLEKHGTPQHPTDLSPLNCLRFSGHNSSPWSFKDGGRRIDVKVAGSFESNLVAPLLDACAKGLGVARVQHYQASPYIRSGDLRVVLQDFEPEPLPVSLVYPSVRHPSARLVAFVDWMKTDFVKALKV